MPVKPIKRIKPLAAEHGGACPTCGHCKCCEKAAQPITPPICTRPHYPLLTRPFLDWTWRPYDNPIWYGGTSSGTTATLTTDNTTSTGSLQ